MNQKQKQHIEYLFGLSADELEARIHHAMNLIWLIKIINDK